MFVDTTTYRAPLTGVLRIYGDNSIAVEPSLVHQFLLKVGIGPAHADIAVSDFDSLCRLANAGQIFKDEQRSAWIGLYECLRDAMIHIAHPTVFSGSYSLEPAPCGRSLSLLEFFSKFGEVCPAVLDGVTIEHRGLGTIVCNGKFPDSSVNADNGSSFLGGLNIKAYGNMHKDLAVLMYNYGSSTPFATRIGKVLLHTLRLVGNLDSAFDGIDRHKSVSEGPVSTIDKVIPVDLEVNQTRLMTVAPDALVFGNHSLYSRLSHLGLQTIFFAKTMIQDSVRFIKVQASAIKHIFGNRVARKAIKTTCRKDLSLLALAYVKLHLGSYGDRFHHNFSNTKENSNPYHYNSSNYPLLA